MQYRGPVPAPPKLSIPHKPRFARAAQVDGVGAVKAAGRGREVLADIPNSARQPSASRRPSKTSPASTPRGAPATAREVSGTAANDTRADALSAGECLKKYASQLSSYERTEVNNYSDIYFTGPEARKIQGSRGANNGFDDDKGDYRIVMGDHFAYRYEVIKPLGRGSFGQVVKVLDHKYGRFCALKVIKNKQKFHEQALVEVKVLKHIRHLDPQDKSHVVRILDNFNFRNHMCITFELHGMNLYELCRNNRFAPMPGTVIKNFAKQLLQTLSITAAERIVHCDLKPENILLRAGSSTSLRVIDFGSACFENERIYTYIQSRFYRAPEVVFGVPYTPQIDMWSMGCILAELANGYPIFQAENEGDLVLCMMEVLGAPPRSMVDKAPRRKHFFDSMGMPRLVPNSRGRVRRPNTKSLAAFLRTTDSDFIDFVSCLLKWDPKERLTPTMAMRHKWLTGDTSVSDSKQNTPRLPLIR